MKTTSIITEGKGDNMGEFVSLNGVSTLTEGKGGPSAPPGHSRALSATYRGGEAPYRDLTHIVYKRRFWK